MELVSEKKAVFLVKDFLIERALIKKSQNITVINSVISDHEVTLFVRPNENIYRCIVNFNTKTIYVYKEHIKYYNINTRNLNDEKNKKKYTSDPYPVILLDDFSNFDGFIALILLQKARNIDLRLIVVNQGFSNVAPGINNVFNMLAWLRNTTTPVIAGSYFSPDEINAGFNPLFGINNSDSRATKINGIYLGETSPKVGQVAQPIYQMFAPPLWKENASTLYGTVGKIPVNTYPHRQYRTNANHPPAYDRIAEVLEQIRLDGKRAIIINSGSHTDLGKFFTKYKTKYDSAIYRVVIMGGGFYNFSFTEFASPYVKMKHPNESQMQRWSGNLFTSPIFSLSPLVTAEPTVVPPPGYEALMDDWETKPPYQTMQEFNIFSDPVSAQIVFNHLYNNNIRTDIVPTDATNSLLVRNNLNCLKLSPTPEGRYVYELISGLRKFEGDGFNDVIRIWDITASLIILDYSVVDSSGNLTGSVDVVQLGSIDELAKNSCDISRNFQYTSPFNILQYNPYVGQTTLNLCQSSITIITKINSDKAFQQIISRLNSRINSAISPMHY